MASQETVRVDFSPVIAPNISRAIAPAARIISGSAGARSGTGDTGIREEPQAFPKAPLRPSGGRGRDPTRRVGGVRWAAPQIASSAPLTLPSPPGRRGER